MKQLIGSDCGGYSFNKTSKTVTLTGFTYNLTLNQILLIINVTDNIIIYDFSNVAKGATQIVNNVITLDYDTSSMSDSDILMIFVDVYVDTDTYPTLLRRMLKLLESQGAVDFSGRQRVVAETITGTNAITNTIGLGPSIFSNIQGGNPYFVPTDPLTYQKDAFGAYIPDTGTSLLTPTLAVTEKPVDQRWRIIDDTRQTYSDSIRSNLSW